MFAVTQLNCSSKYEIFINEGIINTENLHGFRCFFCFLSFSHPFWGSTYFCSSHKWTIELTFEIMESWVGRNIWSRMSYPQADRKLFMMPPFKGISLEVERRKEEYTHTQTHTTLTQSVSIHYSKKCVGKCRCWLHKLNF